MKVFFKIDYIIQETLFDNKNNYPINFDTVISISQEHCKQLLKKEQEKIEYGIIGDIKNDIFPWTFLSGIQVDVFNTSKNLYTLDLVPPKNGTWKNSAHQLEFERISKMFEFFVGIDLIKNFQIQKIVLLQNKMLEEKFQETYLMQRKKINKPKWLHNQDDYEDIQCRKEIMQKLSKYVDNVSGDELTNLILGWHGGCQVPFVVAEENFSFQKDKIDQGYYGNGIYFTKFISYGNKYTEYRKKRQLFSIGTYPLILSWVIMGNPYPVTEKDKLLGQPCVEGYDSHYVLVKKKSTKENLLDYYPCKYGETPDYDEIVIFNNNQILPRYLIYYNQTELNETYRIIIWVDPNPHHNHKIISKIEKNNIKVVTFPNSYSMKHWLKEKDPETLKDIRVISNRFREGDGEESAGVRLCSWFKDENSEWKHVPFMIYCGKHKLVCDLPKYESVFLANEEVEVYEFAIKK